MIIQIDIMGGSERLVYNLALNLDRKIFSPSIAWFNGDKRIEDFKNLNIPLYHVPKIKRFDFSTMQMLGNIIKDNNIHIVNAHHFMSMVYSFYGCKMRNRGRLIYTEHSEWEIEKIRWRWKQIGSFLLKRTDRAVGVSEAVSKQISTQFSMDYSKIVTIQNGVDLITDSNPIKKATIRKKLDIADNEKVIGIVANFRKVKNHIFFLKAFDELVKDFNNIKLLLVGQGLEDDLENSEKEIRNFVAQNDLDKKVMFLGYRSDIPDILAIMDIFCLTSFKEGLPISLIEAMAAGLPVVGTNVDGIKDVIIPGRNGFLVQINDVERLKNVLITLLHDAPLRRKFGEESKFIATSIYSLKRCINKYQDLFLSVLRDNNGLHWRKRLKGTT